MNRSKLSSRLTLVLLGAGLLVGGCATTAPSEQSIRAMEQAQAQAAMSGNRAVLEEIFAPQFQIINPAGVVASREELLRMLAGGSPPYSAANYMTDTVRRYGNVVVTTGTETVQFAGGAQAGQQQRRRITQVWERSGTAWKLALRHATLIAAPP